MAESFKFVKFIVIMVSISLYYIKRGRIMDLEQLQAFLAVVRHGSISRASEELLRTQPAISLRIQNLERDLGHALLERSQRGIALTPAGEILQRRADTVFTELEALRAELADLSSFQAGQVSLGASDTVCLYLLPQVLQQFVQRYPRIDVRLATQISQRVADFVLSGEIDIGIVTLPFEHEGLRSRVLYRDEFVLVYPPSHALSQRKRPKLSDLKEFPIIHLKRETITRRWIDGILEPAGLRGQIRMEVSTIEVVKKLVEVGTGISVLPRMAIDEEIRLGTLCAVRLQGVKLYRPMGLIYRKDKYFSIAVRAFTDHLTEYAKGIARGRRTNR